jgi:hypothetical protein
MNIILASAAQSRTNLPFLSESDANAREGTNAKEIDKDV